MTKPSYEELERLAKMATTGTWKLLNRVKNSQNPSVGTADGEIATCWQKTLPLIEGRVPRNAEYIAAANPQAILDLLSECSRLASRVEELEKLLREIDDVPYVVIPDGCGNGKPCDSCVKVVAIVNRALAQEGE